MLAIAIFLGLMQSHIAIGDQKLLVEIADTQESQARGLMGRSELPENTGMLFVFNKPQTLTFWMKDTKIPLSIAYFDESKKLIDIYDMPVLPKKKDSPPLFQSTKPALYALEVPQNWFKKTGIGKGAEFSFLDRPNPLE